MMLWMVFLHTHPKKMMKIGTLPYQWALWKILRWTRQTEKTRKLKRGMQKLKKSAPFICEAREDEDRDKEGSNGSANTSHSSQDHTSDSSQDGDTMNQTEETKDSQQGKRPQPAPVEDSNPPIPPCINIKDEPIDEGYDAALLPQSSIRHIKQEMEHPEDTGASGENPQGHGENRQGHGENTLAPQRKEELRISSVYSVGGPNTLVSSTVPAAIPAPPPAAIFIPGRGTVLQAMAPLPIRQPTLISSTLPALTPLAPLAPLAPRPPPIPGSVRCSGCAKVLLKGQTAFQRKGSTQLFCSTVCLSGHLPPAPKPRSCCQCNREILQPKDMITIPGDDGVVLNFCSQFCLSVFRHKKKTSDKQPDRWPEKRPENKFEKQPEKRVDPQLEQLFCSVCRVRNRHIEHEVTHQGRLHRLCSDACFVTWRKIRQLAMNCCEGCGLYCNSNSGSCQTLTIDRSQLNFCSPTCIATFKQTCRKMTECANCHQMITVSFTIMERDHKGKVQLYCSPPCVEQSRPPRHVLSGTPFPCSLCKTTAVPQYHLAKADGTIRNFCSYDCVSVYRKSSPVSQTDLSNGVSSPREPAVRDASKAVLSSGTSSVPPIPQEIPSSVPYPGHHPSHTSVPPLAPPYPALVSPSVPGQALGKAPFGQLPKPAEGGANEASRLTCHKCSKQFGLKPVLFSHQGCMSLFCSKVCCDQYKIQKNILAHCEYCKQEKVLFDVINYNQQELFFCSESESSPLCSLTSECISAVNLLCCSDMDSHWLHELKCIRKIFTALHVFYILCYSLIPKWLKFINSSKLYTQY
ncbi:zinc finger MYM-type protein 4-like [Thalassophryne amazonica]|uniref:zinc finger MYM-type protein 4-like n=1 Tax=Thalassophryne amazonica TaxID=390379 RepID=UPI001470978E|nr:zinc finger MYM-type protein 4-like [Thalassophryne amazonica]XP_034015981.1 zinc finger MYM-type protein 4-like [Thalassophryne amazonica]